MGARIDVDAGRVHEVWMGGEGCEYVIGEEARPTAGEVVATEMLSPRGKQEWKGRPSFE